MSSSNPTLQLQVQDSAGNNIPLKFPINTLKAPQLKTSGSVLFYDDFERDDLGGWFNASHASASGWNAITNEDSWTGASAMKVVSDIAASGFGEAAKFYPWAILPPAVKQYGFELWFNIPSTTEVNYPLLGMEYRVASNQRYLGWVRVVLDGTIQIYDSTGSGGSSPITVGTLGAFNSGAGSWHHLKLVIDINALQYVSLQVDDQDVTSSVTGKGLQSSTSGSTYRSLQFFCNVNHVSSPVTIPSVMLVDDCIGTLEA